MIVPPNRVAVVLSSLAVLGCVGAGALIHFAPRAHGGWQPTLWDAAKMIAAPTIAAVVATWAAWRNRRVVLAIATAVVGLFSVVTGFSIGTAFLPAVVLLVWGTFASLADSPARSF